MEQNKDQSNISIFRKIFDKTSKQLEEFMTPDDNQKIEMKNIETEIKENEKKINELNQKIETLQHKLDEAYEKNSNEKKINELDQKELDQYEEEMLSLKDEKENTENSNESRNQTIKKIQEKITQNPCKNTKEIQTIKTKTLDLLNDLKQEKQQLENQFDRKEFETLTYLEQNDKKDLSIKSQKIIEKFEKETEKMSPEEKLTLEKM